MSVVRGGSLLLSVFLSFLLLAPAAAASEEPPGAPRNVAGGTTAEGDFLLTWTPPAQGDVEGYRIYENGALVADISVESYVTAPHAAAAYTVTAYNQFGEGVGVSVVNVNNCIFVGIPPYPQPEACVDMVVEFAFWLLDQILVPAP